MKISCHGIGIAICNLRSVKANIGGETPYSTGHHVKSTHAVDDTCVYVCDE